MAFIGNQPTAVPLTSSQLADGLITTAKLASTSVTTAKVNTAAITTDKLDLISTVSVPAVTAKGTPSVSDGYIQLNCEQNSHGIKLKSPPHAAGANYTLTFPSTTGTSLQSLRMNSGATALEFATASSDFVLLDTQTITTASVVSSVSVNSVFTTTYKCYLITFSNIATDGTSTASNNIIFQVKDTSNNTLSGSDYNFTGMDQVQGGGYLPIGANAQTSIPIVENAYGAADTPITGYIYIFNPRSGARTNFMAMFLSHSQTGFSRVHQTFSLYQANTQIGGFIITANGNATQIKGATGSGFIKTYGLL